MRAAAAAAAVLVLAWLAWGWRDCRATGAAMGFEPRYGLSGCQIRTADGWVPAALFKF